MGAVGILGESHRAESCDGTHVLPTEAGSMHLRSYWA